MVFVDFSSVFLRRYLETMFLPLHVQRLENVRAQVPQWCDKARRSELYAAPYRGRARPLAAVLDIDEVVLANIHTNSWRGENPASAPASDDFYAADYFTGPDGAPWPRGDTRLNPLLPGVKPLLEMFRALDVTVFLVTGRREALRDETAENLEFVGLGDFFPRDALRPEAGRLVMLPDDAEVGPSIRGFKEASREAIAATHHVIANIGDQASDLGAIGDNQVYCPHPFYWTP